MSAGLEFPAESVLRHATAADDASDAMAAAKSAVREVTMDSAAYGRLCGFLPGLLTPVFSSALDVVNHAVDALDETALKLRTTATAMEAADIDTGRRLDDAAAPGRPLPL